MTVPAVDGLGAADLLAAALTTARWPDGSLMVDVDEAILRRQVVEPALHQLNQLRSLRTLRGQLAFSTAAHGAPAPRPATALASRRRRPETPRPPRPTDRRN